jgi:hypothetical protein
MRLATKQVNGILLYGNTPILGLRSTALKPTLDRFGTLRFQDGPTFQAPKVSALESVHSPALNFLGTELPKEPTLLDWVKNDLQAAKVCRSGPCKCAMGIVCRCTGILTIPQICKGASHSTARMRGCHDIREYGADIAPTQSGVYA